MNLIILREWVAMEHHLIKVMEIDPENKLFILASNKFEAKKPTILKRLMPQTSNH